ncbi:dipeptidyl aminopeptidase/acylaminoacyl peptidase [Inhella inkyongensis]|uniref:Dipeptidyl aminopeptidase/acylaminoacyl peptidase n=1 Tax=Inhella inkyongensis TaxID=392593 RepID=A0A840SBD3_9BURK|nr:S9 family peptidase [Inhella inkyongensis]MBB5206094.1 dipeptidyl aminopeptidase/acylaminoacyl peptidase [Inhella inkyongensis]
MPKSPQAFDVDTLWALARIGEPSLSPDGAQAVASVTRFSMEDNKAQSSLYLFSTLGGEPRRLTEAGDKDGAPQWSPTGEQIAFVARREQGGAKDEEAQLYLIAPDGGEACRVATVATGVEAFRWFPDGRRIAFVSWVWPRLKGAKAQAQALKDFKARKESAYVTDELLYRHWDHHIPMGRVPHLLVLDCVSGKVQDLMEGTDYSLDWKEPGTHSFDISPDGRRIVFSFDPAAEKRAENCFALGEIEVKTGSIRVLLQDPAWDFDAPRHSHAGRHLAFVATERGRSHTAPAQLAVLDDQGHWAVVSAQWDREVEAPLRWTEDDAAIRFQAEDEGRRHLWHWELTPLADEPALLFEGGHAAGFDTRGETVVLLHDSVQFPPRLSVLSEDGAQRIEALNDAVLDAQAWGRHEEVWLTGAQGEPVQMWLVFPPGFDKKKKWPALQVIHGGPHTAFGDSWHWRWNSQLMAAQGQVVACVNYHGSSSFGHGFKDSISGRWGQLELQDVEAGTDWLLQQRWIDRRRICASGGSYGGYMVAWMNGHSGRGVDPQRYRAYICHAGCFDWQAMFATDGYTWFPQELGAAYWEDPAKVAAQSPISMVQHAVTPTLVIHGQLDYRVPDAQGLAYYNTLKARGVPARLVWFPDENHWVLKARNSKLWYQEFFAWIARHAA